MPPRKRRARDYAAEYRRRQARARELGYGDYYERRTRRRPGADRPPTEVLAKRRGHRSRSDFLRDLRDGDFIICDVASVSRDAEGRYVKIVKQVIPVDGGDMRDYTLRRLTREQLIATIKAEVAAGAIFSPAPSLDQRRLVSAEESDGGY